MRLANNCNLSASERRRDHGRGPYLVLVIPNCLDGFDGTAAGGVAAAWRGSPVRARPRDVARRLVAARRHARTCSRAAHAAARATAMGDVLIHSGDLYDRPLGRPPPHRAGIAARAGYKRMAGRHNPLPANALHVSERLLAAAACHTHGHRRPAVALCAPACRSWPVPCPRLHRHTIPCRSDPRSRIPAVTRLTRRPGRHRLVVHYRAPPRHPGEADTQPHRTVRTAQTASAREGSAAVRKLGGARSIWPPTSGPRSAGRALRIFSCRQCPDFVAKYRRGLHCQLLAGHRRPWRSMIVREAVDQEFAWRSRVIPTSS